MALKDIEKLREKVDKDPKSKLFVPLAEEYRKEGMTDEAIKVLQEGIEKQPSYMSARVALGKIYLEKMMPKEARAEFESVIKTIPDNLYAHKKLAEIYRDCGERDLAIRSYRTVLKLNSIDEDALYNLNELEQAGEDELDSADGEVLEPTLHEEEPGNGSLAPEDEPEAAPAEPASPPSDEELDDFKNSLFGEDESNEISDAVPAEDDWAEDLANAVNQQSTEAPLQIPDEVPEPVEEVIEIADELPNDPGETPPEDIVELESETDEVTAEELTPIRAVSRQEPDRSPQPAKNEESLEDAVAEADRLIGAGSYAAAIAVYRKMLVADPGERKILQRIEELKALLKITGKDKDALIFQLNSFLDGIKKRRDGFSRNS